MQCKHSSAGRRPSASPVVPRTSQIELEGAAAKLRRAAAQVTTANKKISRAGEVAWKQTKRLRQPSRLLAVFGGRRRGGADADGEEYGNGHDEEGAVDRRPLLSRR